MSDAKAKRAPATKAERGAEEGIDLPVKAVPGAKRDEVVGWLGERLKVRVSQPPEDGKANAAICRMVAEGLGVKMGMVSVARGTSHPEKVLRITGIGWARVLEVWPR